jgi:predicted amidohydrolase YtcJ
MAYGSTGRLAIERASKVGHVKIIQDPAVQRLLDAFERVEDESPEDLPDLSGHIDLSQVGDVENVVAIDGSHAAIPNSLQQHKKLAFITASAVTISLREVQAMKAYPIVDPGRCRCPA